MTSKNPNTISAIEHVLNPELSRKLTFFLYRHHFLILYIIIGVLSLITEIFCFRGLEKMGVPTLIANLLGLFAGIYFAYWMNIRFNFKIPYAKRNRALMYFVVISICSAFINFTFKRQLNQLGWSYEQARFVVSGCLFALAYMFHRRFSFVDYKKVGVAIYANGIEDIAKIYNKIGAFPDFIHVDIVDDTFGKPSDDPRAYRLEVIKAYWNKKPVHVHLMSRKPSRWIKDIAAFADTIYVHAEIDDNINDVISQIRSFNKRAGIALTMKTNPETIHPLASQIDSIMLLTIQNPGHSGQQFDMKALSWIDEINHWQERSRMDLCIDGGVNENNIGLLNVENVASGSSVLNNQNPHRQIMRLQTSSNYEKI